MNWEEEIMSRIISATFELFKIEGKEKSLALLQNDAIQLISVVFEAHPLKYDDLIMGEFADVLVDLPGNKTVRRLFELADSVSGSVQMATALLVELYHIAAPAVEWTGTVTSQSNRTDVFLMMWIGKCVSNNENSAILGDRLAATVEDLLALMNIPQWPGADPLVRRIARILCDVKKKHESNERKVPSKFLTQVVQMLGKVASKFYQDIIWCRDHPLAKTDAERATCKVCSGTTLKKRECIECDSCSRMIHRKCFPILDTLESFQCDDCVTGNQLLQTSCTPVELTDSLSIGDMRQLHLNCIASQGTNTSSRAYQYAIGNWHHIDNGVSDPILQLQLPGYKDLVEQFSTKALRPLSRFTLQKIVQYLNYFNNQTDFSDLLLKHLLSGLGSSQPANRKSALKAVAEVLGANPILITDVNVKTHIEKRLLDTNTSVREVALDILSRFIVANESTALMYQEVLLPRLNDQGVSVRKKAVKTIGTLLYANSHLSFRMEAYANLVERVHDEEESVQILVKGVLRRLIFRDELCFLNKRPSSKTNLVSIGTSCQVLKDLVNLAGYDDWFIELLEDDRCIQFASYLMEELISINDTAMETGILSILEVLDILSKVSSEYVAHISSLLFPYLGAEGFALKPRDQNVARCHIFSIARQNKSLTAQSQKELVASALVLIKSGSEEVMLHAVACVGFHQPAFLTHIQNAFLKFLTKASQGGESSHIKRAILGCAAIQKATGEILQPMVPIVSIYIYDSDPSIRVTAMKSLSLLLQAQPQKIGETIHIIQGVISVEEQNTKVLQELLVSLRSLLVVTESKTSMVAHANLEDVMGDQTSDSCPVALLLQDDSITASLTRLVSHKNDLVRLEAVLLITATIQQGLTNPLKWIEVLVSLEADSLWEIHCAAHCALKALSSRFQDYINQKSPHGIIAAFKTLSPCDVSGVCQPAHFSAGAIKPTFSLFSRLYRDFFTTGTSRKAFLGCVVNLFHCNDYSLRELQFLAEVIATLPFNHFDDILHLMYLINRTTILNESCDSVVMDAFKSEDVVDPALFFQGCLKSQRLRLLLNILQFLKKVYSGVEKRFELYEPSSKTADRSMPVLPPQLPLFEGLEEATLQLFDCEEVAISNDVLLAFKDSFVQYERTFSSCMEVEDFSAVLPSKSRSFSRLATPKAAEKNASLKTPANNGKINPPSITPNTESQCIKSTMAMRPRRMIAQSSSKKRISKFESSSEESSENERSDCENKLPSSKKRNRSSIPTSTSLGNIEDAFNSVTVATSRRRTLRKLTTVRIDGDIVQVVSNDKYKTKRGHFESYLCDICLTCPIEGFRWECLECDDLDVCISCLNKKGHTKKHTLLKCEITKKQATSID